MPLPKIKQPLFELTVPSTNEVHLFRPYLGSEEKILLIAKESGETKDIIMGLKQVIQNCAQDEAFDADDLATFDIEYLFLKLRAKSVDNIVKVAYLDDEEVAMADLMAANRPVKETSIPEVTDLRDVDNLPETQEEVSDEVEPHTFTIDLNEVEMLIRPDKSNIIKINETDGLVMKYPSMREIENLPSFESTADEFSYLIRCCIKSVFDENSVYPVSDYSIEELNEYIDSLPIPVLSEIKEFFQDMPRMYYEIKYVNRLGNERKIVLKSLSDFFTFR